MPQNNPEPQISSNSKKLNLLILTLVILVVAFCGVLFGLITFLLSNQNTKNIITDLSTTNSSYTKYSETSTSTQSLISSTSFSSTLSSSETSMSSNPLTSSLSTSTIKTSQGMTFLHNEGKYIRFDYPSGWKVDVSSRNGDSFTKFEDIAKVSISKNNYEITLDFMGGYGCGASLGTLVYKTDTNRVLGKYYDYATNPQNPAIIENSYAIKNFKAIQLNLPSAKAVYFVQYNLLSSNPNITTLPNNFYQALNYFDGTKYTNIDCNYWVELNKLNVNSEIKNLLLNMPSERSIPIEDLKTIIERFVNSFQKK